MPRFVYRGDSGHTDHWIADDVSGTYQILIDEITRTALQHTDQELARRQEEDQEGDTMTTTFGFELEWEAGVNALVTELSRQHPEHIATTQLHNWHCDCSDCDFGNGIPLRAQSDSTCDGEIISHPFESMAEARPVFEALQDAAVEVDAVPGLTAGLHVHFKRPRLGIRNKAWFEFIRWEPVMLWISQGRFSFLRDFNHYCRTDVQGHVRDQIQSNYSDIAGIRSYDLNWGEFFEGLRDHEERSEILSELYEYNHAHADRHSSLSTNTRFETWEMRCFNSTRSAWRMELFCTLATAWADETFIDHLADLSTPDPGDLPRTEAVHHMVEGLAENYETAATLLDRQQDYMKRVEFGTTIVPNDFQTV